MKIGDLLKVKGRKVWTVHKDQTLYEALQVLVNQKIGALPVVNGQNYPVGIISERDIVRACYQEKEGKGINHSKVESWMTTRVILGTVEDKIEDIMNVMTQSRIRHIPVVEDKQLIGLISIGDVVKSLLKDSDYQIQYLKEFIYGPNI